MLRPAAAPPVAAVLAARVVVLARRRLPHQALRLAAAQLDHVRAGRIDRDAAVEPVAAEVGEAAAALEMGVERVEQRRARVLRVRAGDHGPVPGERVGALVVEVVVGDDVEPDALAPQPGDQDQVLGEAVRATVLRAAVVRPQLGERPQQRRLVDADAVRVAVVERAEPGPGDPAVLGALRRGRLRALPLARVGQVGERRQDEDVRRRVRRRRAADRERNHVLDAVGLEPQPVHASRQRVGQLELEARRPAEVVDGVGVEVHRPVLIRRQAPVVHVAAPGVPGDRAQRAVHARPVQAARAVVEDAAPPSLAEPPRGDAGLAAGPGRDRGPVELAVEMRLGHAARPRLGAQQQRPGRRSRRGRPRARLRGVDGLQAPPAPAPVGERDRRGGRVELGLEPRPGAALDRPRAGDPVALTAGADLEARPAVGIEDERPAVAVLAPGREQGPPSVRAARRAPARSTSTRRARPRGAARGRGRRRRASRCAPPAGRPPRARRSAPGPRSRSGSRITVAAGCDAPETITRSRSPGRAESRSA